MGHKFAEIAFTANVKKAQEANGSRHGYARLETGEDHHAVLGFNEAAFISQRNSFYMASVSETGWPYIQHRGGPEGFLKVLDPQMIGFADFSGNKQYITVGNLQTNDRVSLFLMDYPNRARLKILGRASVVTPDDAELIEQLKMPGYAARVERGIVIRVEAFDWNCSQHITPRFSIGELQNMRSMFEIE